MTHIADALQFAADNDLDGFGLIIRSWAMTFSAQLPDRHRK